MKQIFSLILVVSTIFSYAQKYAFATEFTDGKITLKDQSELSGQIKWYPSQNDKLSFRTAEKENLQSIRLMILQAFLRKI